MNAYSVADATILGYGIPRSSSSMRGEQCTDDRGTATMKVEHDVRWMRQRLRTSREGTASFDPRMARSYVLSQSIDSIFFFETETTFCLLYVSICEKVTTILFFLTRPLFQNLPTIIARKEKGDTGSVGRSMKNCSLVNATRQ